MSFNYSGGFVGNKPNPLPKVAKSLNYLQIIPLEKVAATKYYSDMADLAVIFGHEIVFDGPVWRWREYTFHNWGIEGRTPSLNAINMMMHYGECSMEEWMKFNMQIGYSLSGFIDIFGQHEASEYDLHDCKTGEKEDGDGYVETVIEYMLRVHKGQILKFNEDSEIIECSYKSPKKKKKKPWSEGFDDNDDFQRFLNEAYNPGWTPKRS